MDDRPIRERQLSELQDAAKLIAPQIVMRPRQASRPPVPIAMDQAGPS